MTALMIVLGVLCVGVFVGLFVWMRRSERDVDYVELFEDSTQTDGQRRVAQIATGLVANPPPMV
jgi:flagellar biosynthesis/type III secretory pathway M-ring protein FliF/YscJ